ncbi:MAG: DUF2007 domain-containing protein [Actinobacteria bacterium]|nr:DUF2007 domain-containing protein [Actinomycetota bacterium]
MPARVLLTTTNSFEAKVIAARLQAEGLDAEMRGSVETPYPFMLGDAGAISVWIPEDQLDDARLVMLAAEVDSAMGSSRRDPPVWTWTGRVALAVVLTMLVVSVLARFFS